MHKAVADHPLTDAQPVPEQQPLPPGQLSPVFQHDVIRCGISLWSVGISCPGCVPPRFLCPHTSSPQSSVRSWTVLDSVLSTAWQQLKHQCVTNIVLIPNPKRSAVPATRKKMNSYHRWNDTYYKSIYNLSCSKLLHVFLIKNVTVNNIFILGVYFLDDVLAFQWMLKE